jgi:hypothetical protein
MSIDVSNMDWSEIEKLNEKFPHFFMGTVIARIGGHTMVVK